MFLIGREYVVVFNKLEFDNTRLSDAIENAISHSGLNLLSSGQHDFERNGLTKFWILSESHVALSTWPEKQTGVINVFVCDESFELQEFIEGLRQVVPDASVVLAEKIFEA